MDVLESKPRSLIRALKAGDRRAIGRAITLAETDQARITGLCQEIGPHTGHAQIIGITGPPGSGKSTLIDGLISTLRRLSHTVAVVAVDPSSPISGGAILGDRLRMHSHNADDGVFIRSLSTRGHLGGLTPAVHSIIDILEFAGFGRIILETVGTGQSEIEIAEIAQTIVVLCAPGMGDHVQTLKAGVLEIADILVVNKADLAGADLTVQQLKAMLALRPPVHGQVPVLQTTATTASGLDELVDAIVYHGVKDGGDSTRRRRERTHRLLASRAGALLQERLLRHGDGNLDAICDTLERGERSLEDSARDVLKLKYT